MAGISQPPTHGGPLLDTSADDCPDCGGNVVQDGHDTVCTECSIVLNDAPIDHGPDWRNFEDADDNSHVGPALSASRHDLGLSTQIGHGRDGYGRSLSSEKRRQMHRLRKHHNRAKFAQKRDRSRMNAFYDIRRMCSALGLSESIRDRACSIFADAQDANIILGRSLEFVATGAVYAACRLLGSTVLPNDIGTVSQLTTNDAVQALRLLSNELSLGIPPFSPADHVPRLASELDVPSHRERDALTLARDAETAGLTNGMPPSAVAAAAVYVAGGPGVRQVDAADAANVSVNTLRRHYKRMEHAGLTPE